MLAKSGVLHERSGRYDDALEAYTSGLEQLAGLDAAPSGGRSARGSRSVRPGIHYRQARYEESIAAALEAHRAGRARGQREASSRTLTTSSTRPTPISARADGPPVSGAGAPDLRGAAATSAARASSSTISASTPTTRAAGTSRSPSTAQSREAKERVGDVIGAAVQMNNEAEILSDQGHLDEATAAVRRVAARLPRLRLRVRDRASRSATWDAWPAAPDGFDEATGAARTRHSRSSSSSAAERFANETRARIAECLVFEGQPRSRRSSWRRDCREAARRSPVGGLEALIERTIGYALCQARRRDEATTHFEESLRSRASSTPSSRSR